MTAGTNYTFTILAESGVVPAVTRIVLTYSDPDNRLELSYVPYPRDLTNDEDRSELRFYEESMIRKSKQLAMERQAPDDDLMYANLQTLYDNQLQRDRKKMVERGRGSRGIQVRGGINNQTRYRNVSRRGLIISGTTVR